MAKKITDAMDDKMDAKAGIKENSPKDVALDRSRGVPEDDAGNGRKTNAAPTGGMPHHRARRQPKRG